MLVQLNPACGTGLRQCIDENNDGITEWSVCFHTGTTAEICDGWDNDCICGIDAVDIDADPNVEDCEKISKHVIKLLDVENDFSNKYLLEVSSPGLDRKFFSQDQYSSYLDNIIKVRYHNDLNKKISVKGVLLKVTTEGLVIESGNEDKQVPFSSIIQANLIM